MYTYILTASYNKYSIAEKCLKAPLIGLCPSVFLKKKLFKPFHTSLVCEILFKNGVKFRTKQKKLKCVCDTMDTYNCAT